MNADALAAMAFETPPHDPYLAWSFATHFAGHTGVLDGVGWVPMLMEVTPAQFAAVSAMPGLRMPSLYTGGDRFVSARVACDRLLGVQAQVTHMEFSRPLPETPGLGRQPSARIKGSPVLAVIDRGCAFLNTAFRELGDQTRTRLLAVWDQGQAPDSGRWQRPSGMGYGRELVQSDINQLIAGLAGQSESSVYREHAYLLDAGGRVRESAHGTHVLDTAAGCLSATSNRASAKPLADDAASSAPLIFVDVPGLGPNDTTGASSGAYLLDALKYIRHRAGEGTPVVVNISLGALAGPHDGSSLTERAIDDFLKRDGSMLLTLAAGNAAAESWHAFGKLAGPRQAELRWQLRADDPTDSFLELWLSVQDDQADPEVQLESPDGQRTPWLKVKGYDSLLGPAQGLRAGIYPRQPSQSGAINPMVLVALAPCAGLRRAALAGRWCVRLRDPRASAATLFDAWIQRDEPDEDGGVPIQSWFESVAGEATISGEGALSSLATATRPLVVGAANGEDGSVSFYSSRGVASTDSRPGVRAIDLLAAADESASRPGLMAAGVLGGSEVRMGGTSVASPMAARQLFSDMSKFPVVPIGSKDYVPLKDRQEQWLKQLPAGPHQRKARPIWRPG